jgi:alpha-L-fucosidase
VTTRREFVKLAAEIAPLSLLGNSLLPVGRSTQAITTMRSGEPRKSMLRLQQQFVDLRFCMFLHFNMATFQDREWGDPTVPTEQFSPTALDTDQWAMAAKSAKMTWGCLKTRHHDGFCIWPTKTRAGSIRQTSHQKDIVCAFVDSFRAAGLKVGLYYSNLSLRDDIRHFNMTTDKIQLIKDQLTESLSNYGEIDRLPVSTRIVSIPRVTARRVRLLFESSKDMPHIAEFGIYDEPA